MVGRGFLRFFTLIRKKFTPHIDSIMAFSPWEKENKRDKELITRATTSRVPGDFEQKFLRPDGRIAYYYSTFQGRYDENGELITIIGTILDITDRKYVEEKLRETNEYLSNLFNYANAPIIVWNTSLVITQFNHAFEGN